LNNVVSAYAPACQGLAGMKAAAGKNVVNSERSKVNTQPFHGANFTKFSFLFEKTQGKSAPVYLRAELSTHFI